MVLAEEDNSGSSQKLRGNVLGKEHFIGEMSLSVTWGNNIVVEFGRKIIEYRLWASDGQGSRSMPVELTHTHTLEENPLRLSHSLLLRYVWVWNELPVQVRCMILDAWGWCTGMTQRDGVGREEGGGFRMGSTCIPVEDSFQYLAKPIQYCKV